MSETADITQRAALDQARADGKREALADVLAKIDELGGNTIYRKAGKRIAIEVAKMIKAVNLRITQA